MLWVRIPLLTLRYYMNKLTLLVADLTLNYTCSRNINFRLTLNFCKESFLIDHTQKAFSSGVTLNLFLKGSVTVLLSTLNKLQTSFVSFTVSHPLMLVKLSLSNSPLHSVLNILLTAVVLILYIWLLWLVL